MEKKEKRRRELLTHTYAHENAFSFGYAVHMHCVRYRIHKAGTATHSPITSVHTHTHNTYEYIRYVPRENGQKKSIQENLIWERKRIKNQKVRECSRVVVALPATYARHHTKFRYWTMRMRLTLTSPLWNVRQRPCVCASWVPSNYKLWTVGMTAG